MWREREIGDMGLQPLTRISARPNEIYAWRECVGEEEKEPCWTTMEGVGVSGYERLVSGCEHCEDGERVCWCRVWETVGKGC
jgi:hypothetical protein